MNINGVELNFDILDVEDLQRYEQAVENRVKVQVNEEELDTIEVIKQRCEEINHFFDDIFGEGTAQKLFKGKKNLRICLDALDAFETQLSEQGQAVQQKYQKYQPQRTVR